jgi:hypothetical protein
VPSSEEGGSWRTRSFSPDESTALAQARGGPPGGRALGIGNTFQERETASTEPGQSHVLVRIPPAAEGGRLTQLRGRTEGFPRQSASGAGRPSDQPAVEPTRGEATEAEFLKGLGCRRQDELRDRENRSWRVFHAAER